MKTQLRLLNLLLLFVLVIAPVGGIYAQTAGSNSQQLPTQQGTSPGTAPANGAAPNNGTTLSEAPQVPPPGGIPGEVQPGVGNTEQVAQRNVAWGWAIVGFIIGLFVGAVTWRRPRTTVVRPSD